MAKSASTPQQQRGGRFQDLLTEWTNNSQRLPICILLPVLSLIPAAVLMLVMFGTSTRNGHTQVGSLYNRQWSQWEARTFKVLKDEIENRAWWLKELGLVERPWEWIMKEEGDPETDERTFSEFAFPCETTCGEVSCDSGVRRQRAKCRLDFPDPMTLFDGMNTSNCLAFLQTHAKRIPEECVYDLDEYCRNNHVKPLPSFQFASKRDPFTLADVGSTIAKMRSMNFAKQRPRKQNMGDYDKLRPANNARILFMGDSVAHEFYLQARCHIMRTVQKETGEITRFLKGPPSNYWPHYKLVLGREKRNRIEFMLSSDFVIPASKLHPDGSVNLTLSLQLSNRAVTDDLELLLDSCLRNDLVVFDWGLHYFDPFAGEYEAQMIPVMNQFKRCVELSNGRTTVVYANHPAQHFFDLNKNGWYYPHDRTNLECKKIPRRIKAIDDLDGWTTILRNITKPGGPASLTLTPIPWGKERLAYCPEVPKKQLKRVFWVPYIDLTEAFHEYHRPKKMDCTHLVSLPHLGTPLWDALFWSVRQQNNEYHKQCEEQPPVPAFSALAKYRDKAKQYLVNQNYREHYQNSHRTNEDLMPLIGKRKTNMTTWLQLREKWMNSMNLTHVS